MFTEMKTFCASSSTETRKTKVQPPSSTLSTLNSDIVCYGTRCLKDVNTFEVGLDRTTNYRKAANSTCSQYLPWKEATVSSKSASQTIMSATMHLKCSTPVQITILSQEAKKTFLRSSKDRIRESQKNSNKKNLKTKRQKVE